MEIFLFLFWKHEKWWILIGCRQPIWCDCVIFTKPLEIVYEMIIKYVVAEKIMNIKSNYAYMSNKSISYLFCLHIYTEVHYRSTEYSFNSRYWKLVTFLQALDQDLIKKHSGLREILKNILSLSICLKLVTNCRKIAFWIYQKWHHF